VLFQNGVRMLTDAAIHIGMQKERAFGLELLMLRLLPTNLIEHTKPAAIGK
jgi:hypothetical protein